MSLSWHASPSEGNAAIRYVTATAKCVARTQLVLQRFARNRRFPSLHGVAVKLDENITNQFSIHIDVHVPFPWC